MHVVVEVAEYQGDFGGVELHCCEGKATCAPEVGEDFTAGRVLELERASAYFVSQRQLRQEEVGKK